MFVLEKEKTPWSMNCGFNLNVDFCFWVLEQGHLTNNTDWQSWVDTVVATQDSRLCWKKPHPNSIEETLAFFQASATHALNFVPNLNIDLSYAASSLEAVNTWHYQQYQKALLLVGQFNQAKPPLCWTAASEEREKLMELWQQYLPLAGDRNNNDKPKHGTSTTSREQLWLKLQPYRTHLDTLQIYRVAHTDPIELLVPPVSVVLSFQNGATDSEEFCDCVLRAAENLYNGNKSG